MEDSGRTCTYSFGDDGLTATVSPSGRLLRISRHFRGEKFGYCVDHWSIPEPYMVVNRITSFLSTANDPDYSIGFYPDQDSWVSDVDVTADFTDDRWPTFDINGQIDRCKIQYSISDGAIYQTFEFSNGRPPMTFMPSLLLRQLEFFENDNFFNEDDKNANRYKTHLLNGGKCIKRSHKLDQDDNKHAALFVYAFSGDVALTFEEFTEREDVANKEDSEFGKQGEKKEGEGDEERDIEGEQKGDEEGEDDAERIYYRILDDKEVSKPTKVTLIYILSLESGELELLPSPPKFTSAPKIGNIDGSKERKLTDEPELNVALRRNLEYILSVCSVPVYPNAKDDKEFAVALTCGDIDSHRVATAASFHCFQFLLMALKHFVSSIGHDEHGDNEAANCNPCCLIKRIRKVLQGHLKWVFGEEYRNLAKSPSCPHVWVNGEEIEGWKDNQYLSSESLVDAPFQLIKAGDYKQFDDEWTVPKVAKLAVKTWVEELDPKNKLGCYAFPRDIKEPTHSFYLTDHVMIWRTAKCVELLGLKSELSVVIPEEGEDETKRKARKREYLSSRIQSQILKRFTAENPASTKRMLSVSRSPGHVRFLLRTRDTLLFHAMDSQLFDKPGAKATRDRWQNKIDIWKNLVDCQPLHEDNEDTSWDEPLRFALSVIMACTGKAMNSRSPREMHKRGMNVLLESKWANGLFPGQLDVDGEPAIYNDEVKRDRYWGNSFEIAYLLWKYSECPPEVKSARLSLLKQAYRVTGTEPELDFEPAGSQKALLEYQRNGKGLNYASSGPMKRTFPWNNIVDQTNIVELSDEWLYDIPDFFKNVDNSDINDAAYAAVYRYKYEENFRHLDPVKVSLEGAVIDVPRSKAGKKMPPKLVQMLTYVPGKDELARLVSKKRLPCKAKKRLYVLFAAQPEANMPYPQTNSETRLMDNFYRRHKSYDKHFSEDTAAEMNRWTTELHLSFNALDQTLEIKSQESSTAEDSTCQKKGLEGFVSLVEDVGSSGLKQMVMSMRFEGDFFDRYWTCYLLDCNPDWLRSVSHVNSAVRTMLYNKGGEGRIQLDNNKESWRQRRILELLLFQAMVDRMHSCTSEILEDSRSIAKEDDIFWNDYSERSASDYDAFRRNINICQERLREHQQRLQTVEQDIAENFVQIDLWLKRERERQTERPRWTFNDEIKYRGIISKLLNQNDHTIQDLRRCQSSLRILIEKLNRMLQELDRKLDRLDKELEKQDRVREANRNADIQRFTYVTVIFLPLGFATGVFSTSGAPSGTTLRNMALTAIGAFAVTGILIACATNLEVVQKSFQKFKEFASSQKAKELTAFQKAKETWKEIKLPKKKLGEQKDGSQSTEEEMRFSEEGSRRSVESSRSSGRESADGEGRSVLSERSGHREEVRGSDNNV